MVSSPDALVVGGGPAGTAAAYWLARDGHEVLLVDKAAYPRDKVCGDGLTPRAVCELLAMGFPFPDAGFHRCRGLRAYAGQLMLEMEWPAHSVFPDWGGVMRRCDLDAGLARLAESQGARLLLSTEARPLARDASRCGVALEHDGEVEVVEPRIVVVADGALSRFGRALGAVRDRRRPFGVGVRGYYASPRSSDPYLESHLALRDPAGAALPGYGWVFPLGDGTVNVGVGVVSTFHRHKEVAARALMGAMVATAPSSWGLAAESALGPVRGGMLPMAFSMGPLVGANWVLIGDAAGAINPFNGEGIAYALQTGHIAAGHVGRALKAKDNALLAGYRDEIEDTFGLYHRVGRVFVKAIGRPGVMPVLTGVGLRSRPLMEWVLKVMANLLDPQERGVGIAAWRLLERLVQMAPEP
jgi:geranylgeranyl reductase family protein